MGLPLFDGNGKTFLNQYGKTVFRGCKEQYQKKIWVAISGNAKTDRLPPAIFHELSGAVRLHQV